MSMKWNDIDDIVEKLDEQYPDFDIVSVRYTLLKKMICELKGFADEQSKCNEKILEAIQSEWLSYRNDK